MNSKKPQIGFDRFIQLDWAAAALRVRAGVSNLDELTELIDATHSGPEAKKKTRTVLNRLWLEPRPDLADFAASEIGPTFSVHLAQRCCRRHCIQHRFWLMVLHNNLQDHPPSAYLQR